MEIKTIKIPDLSKKAFKVATTNRNIMRLHKYQLSVMRSEEAIETEDTKGQIESNYAVIQETLSFLRAILDLPDEEYDKLLDLDFGKTQEISQRVSGYLMGLSDEDLAEVAEPQEKKQ